MALNRYDQAAQAQFIPTYVPIPFEEMLAAGKTKLDRYDRASSAIDATIASMEDITAIPNSADEIRARGYANKMREIRDKYVNRDLSDSFVQRELSNELHSSINKDDIKHIQQSFQGYSAYNKQIMENEARGVPTPNELRRDFTGYDSSSNSGVFTGTAPVYLDPMQETSTFFKEIRPDSLGSFKEKIDGVETGRIGTRQGVTENKVLTHAQQNMDAFLALPSIRQMVSVARLRGDDRDSKEIAMDYVKSNAKKWAYSTNDNLGWEPEYIARGRNQEQDPLPTEMKGLTGQNEEESGERSGKYWDDKLREYEDAAKNATTEEARNQALNLADNMRSTISANKGEARKDIDEIYAQKMPVLQQKIADLFEKKGSNKEAGKLFIETFLAQDNIEQLLEGQRFLYKTGAHKIFNTKIDDALENAFSTMFTGKNYVIPSERSEISREIGEILKQQFKATSNAKDKTVEDFNTTTPQQETYTMINNEYITDSSDRELYETPAGDKIVSTIHQPLKDFANAPDNYMAYFKNGEDLSKSKKTLKAIKNALDNKEKIRYERIYDTPDAQGNFRADVAIYSKVDGKMVKSSEDMELMLPANIYQNKKHMLKELRVAGKENLAWNLEHTNGIINHITSLPWHSTNQQALELDGGNVIIRKSNNLYDVYLKLDGQPATLEASGLSYQEMPMRAKDVMFKATHEPKQ